MYTFYSLCRVALQKKNNLWTIWIIFEYDTNIPLELKLPPTIYQLRTLHSNINRVKRGNRGDMRKIHVTREFFEASGRHGDFFEKTKKNPFLDKVYGSMFAKFQVCIVFRLTRRRDTNKYTNTQIHTYTSY